MNNQLRYRIIQIVDLNRGINGRMLVARLLSEFSYIEINEVKQTIMDLVDEKAISEIEFTIGKISESLFLPANSVIIGVSK